MASNRYEASVCCSRSGCGNPARWMEVLTYIVAKDRASTARLCDGCAGARRSVAVVVREHESVARALVRRLYALNPPAVEAEDFDVSIEAWG